MYGGDITDITYSNSEVGSGVFRPKASEGNTYNVGGFRNADNKAITTDGTRIRTKNRVPGFFEVLISNDMNTAKDMEACAKLSASTADTIWTFTLVNGKSYRGKGDLVGDYDADTDKATMKIRVESSDFAQI